jgi:uncharacterized cupin superfamily protein
MTTSKLVDAMIDFSIHAVSAETAEVAPERMVSGEPCHTATWNRYTDRSGQFLAGIRGSDVGVMKIVYTKSCAVCWKGESSLRTATAPHWNWVLAASS